MPSQRHHRADPEERLRHVGHALAIIFLAFAFGLGLAWLTNSALVLIDVTENSEPLVWWSVLLVAQFVGFFVAVAAYLQESEQRDLIGWRVPTLRDLAWIVVGLGGVIAVAIVVSAIISVLEADQASNQVVELGEQNPELFLVMIPITILFVGPAEELVFRGVVQGNLRRAYGVVPAIVLASALFGVVHVVAIQGSGKLTYILVVMALGTVLGTIYEITENVVVPAVVHGLWNALLFGLLWAVHVGLIPEAA